jgi:hypothetical protein
MAVNRPRSLLHPRTFCVVPAIRASRLRTLEIRWPGARRVSRGGAAVALLLDERHIDDARRRAPLVVTVGPARTASLTGLWTRELHAAITVPPGMRTGRGACLLAQGRRLAELALEAAHARGLGLEAAFVADAPEALVQLARALPESARVLLVLHSDGGTEHLFRLAASGRRIQLLLPGETALAEVARSLGLAVARSPEELIALAQLDVSNDRLTAHPGNGVRLEARHADEAALLVDAVRRAGLTVATRRSSSGPVISATGKGPAVLRLKRGQRPLPVTRETLEALATLSRLPAQAALGRRPRAAVTRARRLLDGWNRELHQVQLQEILACYGVESPPSALATSASMAGELAGRIGFPVAVKVVGPTLHDPKNHDAVRLDVRSAAGARQAFRDVLLSCSRLQPRPILEGVLIQAMVPPADRLCLALRWLPEAALMQIENKTLNAPTRVAVCPASRPVADQLAGELAPNLTRQETRALSQLLHRISWLGADLAGRMRWLRLDAISLRRAALVVDACGEQTESLRAPS